MIRLSPYGARGEASYFCVRNDVKLQNLRRMARAQE
nr:MAG TPA: hypothetical protein [Caudoviricetes sp.]